MTHPVPVTVTEVDAGEDAETDVLHALAGGNPYVFVVITDLDEDGFAIRVATNVDEGTAKAILSRAHGAMP